MQIIDQAIPGPCNGPQVSMAGTLPGPWEPIGHFQCALEHADLGNCRCSVCFIGDALTLGHKPEHARDAGDVTEVSEKTYQQTNQAQHMVHIGNVPRQAMRRR